MLKYWPVEKEDLSVMYLEKIQPTDETCLFHLMTGKERKQLCLYINFIKHPLPFK